MYYEFLDINTKQKIVVDRPMAKRDDSPNYEEVVNDNTVKMTEEEYKNAKWERVISGGSGWTRGKNYVGSKGNWGRS